MKIIMPSGIQVYLPVKSVTGKAHKLESIMRAVVAIEAKAEKIKDSPRSEIQARKESR